MKTILERIRVLSNSETNYTTLNNPGIFNDDFRIQNEPIEEHPFKWTNIISDIFISAILTFGIFFLIAEVHEITHHSSIPQIEVFNNSMESLYLFLVSTFVICHLAYFRWNRNCWYGVPFDNYPMLIIMCIYAIVEIIYYTMLFISTLTSCDPISRTLCSAMELIFMTWLLPKSIITKYLF